MSSSLPPDLAALDLQSRASQAMPLEWTLAQAVAAAPLIAQVTVRDPANVRSSLPVARRAALPNPLHAYLRVQHCYHVVASLRGEVQGEIHVDAALWQLHLDAHRKRVLQQLDVPTSVPRVIDGMVESPQPGEEVLVLLRRTPWGLEFAAQNAVLHVELLDVVRALLTSSGT